MSDYATRILADAPVAYWRLGEASGTTLYDATPNGYDLTTFNSPTLGTTGLLAGDLDTAVTFDGVNQRATSNSVEFSLSPNNEITIECWFKPNRGSGVGDANACGPVYLGGVAFIWDHAAPSFQDTFAANIAGTWRTVALPAFTQGEVYHLVGTISTTEMKVYVNGALSATGAFAGGTNATTQTVSIGGHPTVATSFASVIDEVAIYDYPLTAAQIHEHYVYGTQAGYARTVMLKEPVAYWRLGESSGTTLYDTAGSYDLTTANSPTLGATGLLVDDSDTAVTFNGVNQYATKDSAFRSTDTQGSVEFWFSSTADGDIFLGASDKDQGNTRCNFGLEGGRVSIYSNKNGLSGNGIWTTRADLADGQAHHVVFTSSGSAWAVYVDGVAEEFEVSIGSNTGDWFGDLVNPDSFTIGTVRKSSMCCYFDGTIDEVAVYDYPLTAAQVRDNYLTGRYLTGYAKRVMEDQPVAYWRLGESSGGTLYDETANGYHLTVTGAPTLGATSLLSQETNTAVTFDGTDDYVSRAEANFRSGDSQGSIEAWINLTDVTSLRTIFSSGDISSNDDSVALVVNTDGALRFLVIDLGDSGFFAVNGSTNVADGNPHHVVVTSNGSTVSMYVDGVAESLTVTNGTNSGQWFDDVAGRDNVTLGALIRSATGTYFNGTIDEVAIYSTALSADTIEDHYAWGTMDKYERAVRTSNPVAYWRLGESSGTTAVDEIGSYDLTYTNSPTLGQQSLVASETDKAVTFNGANQYASLQNAAFGISTYTFEAWIKITNLPGSGDKDMISGVADSYNSSTTDKLLRVDENGTLHAYVYDGAPKNVSSSVNLSTGTTYHVVMVAGASTLKLYINGVERGSVAATGSYTGFSTPTLLLAGKTVGTSTSSLHFDGTLDEVAVYDRVLTADEVAEHYMAGITVTEIPGVSLTLYNQSTPQANLTGLRLLWWDSSVPTGTPAYVVTDETTDANGVLELDLTGNTTLSVGDTGFLMIYKEDGTDYTDSPVFASKWVVQDNS